MGKPESIILNTQDGVRLAGVYVHADHPRSAALLLHMMPATKESWSAFAFRLSSLGVASLAIDLRGHGASRRGPEGLIDYKDFDDAGHQAARLDVEAALSWLREKHPGLPLIAVGASIGANLALQATAEHADVTAVLALSPGLEYHGVAAQGVVRRLRTGQKAMLAASREDAYAASSVETLASEPSGARVETLLVDGAGHGTAMLERDPALADRVSSWIETCL